MSDASHDLGRADTEAPLFVVRVKDEINGALAGRDGAEYKSPPQPHEQASALVAALLGHNGQELNGPWRWRCRVAGGRRTVWLEQGDG